MLRGSTVAAWAVSVTLASPSRVAAAPEPVPVSGETEAPSEDEPPAVEPPADEPPADEPPADEPAPEAPRSVFAPTAPPTPSDGVPEAPLGEGIPGGYWDADKAQPKEPPDGDEEVLVGSIILPLGIIGASSSAAMVWLSTPGHCQQRWAALDAKPDAQACKGVYAFGWVRITYGTLMIVTGAALLGVGLHRRKKHEQWERGYAMQPRMGVGFASTGAAVSLSMRIGLRPRRLRRR